MQRREALKSVPKIMWRDFKKNLDIIGICTYLVLSLLFWIGILLWVIDSNPDPGFLFVSVVMFVWLMGMALQFWATTIFFDQASKR